MFERIGPVRAHHHDVLEPHPEATGEVDPRLDREGVAHRQRRPVPGHQIGILVLLDPDPVPGPVDEVLPEAGLRR